MIDRHTFNERFEELRARHLEVDDHVLRLHLMAHSVWNHIAETKLCISLLFLIRCGSSVLRSELLETIMSEDSLEVNDCPAEEYDKLKDLVFYQIEEDAGTVGQVGQRIRFLTAL